MMTTERRDFIKLTGLGAAGLLLPFSYSALFASESQLLPPRLKEGDLVGIISPAGPTFKKEDLSRVESSLSSFGLRVRFGRHVLSKHGYLAGKDEERVSDIHEMFADNGVNAIMAMRGGWGSNRLLDKIDYDLIRKNPKIVIGFSDITSLLIAINAKTGLITFNGPVATSKWGGFTSKWFKKILMEGERVSMQNPLRKPDGSPNNFHKITTINSGIAEGKLIGGNLTAISSMLGSDYLPDWKKSILFLEEVNEKIYRIDRLLTQLKLAGVLDKLSGIIMGKCIQCEPSKITQSLSLEEVFADRFKPLGIPVYTGAMIGHIERIFTLPIGVKARMNADTGTIELLESAVS